ncbi:MAG: diguanylate cyclase [Mariprofundaceae bacterium]
MESINVNHPIVVLLIDDQKTVVRGIEKMLAEHPDIDFHACTDARQAVQMVCETSPSVILQDTYMPHSDGFDLIKKYAANKAIGDIPVIMISAESDADAKARAFLAGADDYIVKPPHPVELVARVRHHSQVYFDHLEREKILLQLRKQHAELEDANRQLKHLATTDALTQIPNRMSFDKQFLQEWRLSVRNKTPFSIAMVDIDNFKQYNDFYGHQQGDTCLQQVANTMAKVMRRPTDMIARYGGEEFAVICPDTATHGGEKIAENLCLAVESLNIPHERAEAASCVTISVGMASNLPGKAGEDKTPEELLKAADTALYHSKKSGRNRFSMAVNQ